MNEYESLNHTKWECKHHVVFIPRYRRKALSGSLRKNLGSLFRELARHKECEIGEEKADQPLDQLGLFGGESRFERLQD